MKILIDTNIYLDFYRSNRDTLKLFEELSNHFDKIILTDQIIMEFERNRETVIRRVKQSFEAESNIDSFSSSYLQNLPVFKELVVLQKQYVNKKKEVSEAIGKILTDPSQDPIASFFKVFVDTSTRNGAVYNTTDEIISKARQRKLVGNPPASAAYSIGDEINWEIILANVREDIILVGRDNTYKDNFSFLQRDFHKQTGCYINSLSDSITKALKIVGVEPSADSVKLEESLLEDVTRYNEFWKFSGTEGKAVGSGFS